MVVDIQDITNYHLDNIKEVLSRSSDIIKIMDAIIYELGEVEQDVKKIIDNFDEGLFSFFAKSGYLDLIKTIQIISMQEINNMLNELNNNFTLYLDELTKKRIINVLDKFIILELAKLLIDITFGNSASKYLIQKIESFEEKKYLKKR